MSKFHSMAFPVNMKKETIVFSSAGDGIPVNSTRYIQNCDQAGPILGALNASATVSYCQYLVTRPGFMRNLCTYSYWTPGVGESYTYTVMVNGVATTLTCATSGAVNRQASDLVNVVKVVAGDRITLQVVTSLNASVGGHCCFIGLEMNMVREKFDHINWYTDYYINPGTSYFFAMYKYETNFPTSGGELSDHRTGLIETRKGTLKNMAVFAAVAPGVGKTFTYTVRINAVNSALAVVLAGAQIAGVNVSNAVHVNPNDRITMQLVVSAGAVATNHAVAFDFEDGEFRTGW